MSKPSPLVAELERYLEYGAPSGCWLWSGSAHERGYGHVQVKRSGRSYVSAHRLAWLIYRGPIFLGLHVLHKCDTPACCNPDHLFLGTAVENAADRQRKGRGNQARGEGHGHAILDERKVREIRKRLENDEWVSDLAAEYGVSVNAIYNIRSGKTWKEVRA